MRRSALVLVLVPVLLTLGCARCGPPLVLAAASLADVMLEVEQAYRDEGGGDLAFSFAGSNELARQALAGAPAALFVSADRYQVERVENGGAALGAATPWAGNRLVVIAAGADDSLLEGPEELLRYERIALADPVAVPAGRYARQWLESAGLWNEVAPRVVPVADVRAALAAVTSGSVEAGIVYQTDAAAPGLRRAPRVVYRIDRASAEVTYYVLRLRAAGGAAAAESFHRFLMGPRAARILEAAGFLAIERRPTS